VVGAATLLLAGFCALTQKDIKRVLAYSTMSQIGYMFLALGVGAWTAAMFHFMIHAFFKALLFLGAGAVIHYMDGEHDMFQMGGLRRPLPLTFWTFLIASASLAALPLISSGFYSKDRIIWQALAAARGGGWLWAAALAGALLTAVYTFRMVFLTFAGPLRKTEGRRPGPAMNIGMLGLAGLTLVAGFLQTPDFLGGVRRFSTFLCQALPATVEAGGRPVSEILAASLSGGLALLGLALAYWWYGRASDFPAAVMRSPMGRRLHRFWFGGWGFDRLYDWLLVRPYVFLARLNREDIVDTFFDGLAGLGRAGHLLLGRTQNGRVRTYVAGLALGAAILLAMAVWP
jgi:NADH-quinone oxidoreductase subunit L